MSPSEVRAAEDAAQAVAARQGQVADEAVVLQASNRLALRLLPCDVLARVAPKSHGEHALLEVEVARRVAQAGGPVAELEPRVEPRTYLQDRFVVSLWTYYEPASAVDFGPAQYADALARLHGAMRDVDVRTPHFTDRIAEAQLLVEDTSLTPELGEDDRELLKSSLWDVRKSVVRRGAPEQLLHGEPHPGNVLRTPKGLLFIDFESACRGPVEFDIAHMAERAIECYPGADQTLVRECRVLVLAMVAAWRWDRNDRFPDGRRMGMDLIDQLRGVMSNGD